MKSYKSICGIKDNTLTQEELKKILTYDPASGKFTWNDHPHPRLKRRTEAGTLTARGYVTIGLNGAKYQAHRLAWFWMTGTWPIGILDHMDGIKNNNRFANLRMATISQNNFNFGMSKANTSGYRGVHKGTNPNSRTDYWEAYIGINNKSIYLGIYATPEEASEAYMLAAESKLERVDFILMKDKLEY